MLRSKGLPSINMTKTKSIKLFLLAAFVVYVFFHVQMELALFTKPYWGEREQTEYSSENIGLIKGISERITRIEKMLAISPFPDYIVADKTTKRSSLLTNGKELCEIIPDPNFPDCLKHFQWMKTKWKSNRCFSDWGVNGSACSILIYLSEVESWCALQPGRTLPIQNLTQVEKPTPHKLSRAESFEDIYQQMGSSVRFSWMKERISSAEQKWKDSAIRLFRKSFMQKIDKKHILVHMGLVAGKSGENFARNAKIGKSALGELVQWADLIATLHALGHRVFLSADIFTTIKLLGVMITLHKACPPKQAGTDSGEGAQHIDIIYTDIHGVQAFQQKFTSIEFNQIRCKLRIVDSFGTEAAFNDPDFAEEKGTSSKWGGLGMNLKQFNTMFPHTPDNTFLGFVTESHRIADESEELDALDKKKLNMSVGYGKEEGYWKGKTDYINLFRKFSTVHGTFNPKKNWKIPPQEVVNHGVVSGDELERILKQAKVFFGLGFPYEGSGPLEAIANGAVFINPLIKRDTPEGKKLDEFFTDKPTSRRPSSQNPYCEKFIGPPYVYTVDINNRTQVSEVLHKIFISKTISPLLPHEYTFLGMLERVAVQVQMQDFCSDHTELGQRWPPVSALKKIVSKIHESCVDACEREELRCEPTYFDVINSNETFTKLNISCNTFITADQQQVYHPSFKDDTCYLQSNSRLYSCAGADENGGKRLCPCRDFIRHQISLCQSCLPAA